MTGFGHPQLIEVQLKDIEWLSHHGHWLMLALLAMIILLIVCSKNK